MPVEIVRTAVSAGMPPIRPEIAIEIAALADLGAIDSHSSRPPPRPRASNTLERMAVTLPDPERPEQGAGGFADDFGMAIERHGHCDDGRPEQEMHELGAVEIPFIRCAGGGQDRHHKGDRQQGGVEKRHLVASLVHRHGGEVGTERQAQPEQWRGSEELQPTGEAVGAHGRADASTASMPDGDSHVTTNPVMAIVAVTETSRTSRMLHHWVAIIGK